MDIVDTYTDIPGTVNEKLAARKFAIEYLKEHGQTFAGSPKNVDLCRWLGIIATRRKWASEALLEWAANRRAIDA